MLKNMWIALSTNSASDAGTNSRLVLTVNSGQYYDRVHYTIPDTRQDDLERARDNVYEVRLTPRAQNLNITALNPSSIRLGIRGDDEWRCSRCFVWAEDSQSGVIPLSVFWHTTITPKAPALSTEEADQNDENVSGNFGGVSMNIPRVATGGRSTPIRRLVFACVTRDTSSSATSANLRLTIESGNQEVVDADIAGDHGTDRAQALLTTALPNSEFTRANLGSGSIRLRVDRNDRWTPESIFLFGVDNSSPYINSNGQGTATLTPLVYVPKWDGPPVNTTGVSLPLVQG